ncbi:MAG: NAD(P)H-dependent oxidoreductase [Actinobacteria bacterium]|nr:NAD(P)H-dependent oxidoreductase [Actinomycetota bacterium]MBM3815658.1 NAD(P)H-dependent oxidoreductase [Actinomycetota bacterium]
MSKQIIVVSGSLRKASFTTALCKAIVDGTSGDAATGASGASDTSFVLRDYVRVLPHYDGDLDTDTPPQVVAEMRAELAASHAVLIGTPEYNYNIPGGLKNFIDWASRPFAKHSLIGRRMGVFGCSPGDRGGKASVDYLRNMIPLFGATLVGPELLLAKINTKIAADGAVDSSVLEPLLALARELGA